jgi:hypothetical protein
MLLDILEVPQRRRRAGACRRLAKVMAALGWAAVRVLGLTRVNFLPSNSATRFWPQNLACGAIEQGPSASAGRAAGVEATWSPLALRGDDRALGYQGCSGHSGRRMFINNAVRKISTVGGSLRDIQMLAGHSAHSTTQRYIKADAAAQRMIMDLV